MVYGCAVFGDRKFCSFLDLFLGGLFWECLGVGCFFGDLGGTFEVEFVAVGIGERGDPEGITDEGFAESEVVDEGVVVDGVLALEADGQAFAAIACGDFAGTVLLA
jgi:hypothetical protein